MEAERVRGKKKREIKRTVSSKNVETKSNARPQEDIDKQNKQEEALHRKFDFTVNWKKQQISHLTDDNKETENRRLSLGRTGSWEEE